MNSSFKNNSYSIAYLVSPNFSGSTLLSYLISSHAKNTTIGERNKFWRKMFSEYPIGSQTCSCGKNFRECEYWREIKKFIEKETPPYLRGINFPDFYLFSNYYLNRFSVKLSRFLALRNHIKSMPWPLSARFNDVLAINYSLIQYVLETNNAKCFLDSSKSPYHVVYLDLHPQLEIKVIQILRDGRGYLHSSIKREPTRSIQEICKEWNFVIRRNQKLLSAWAGPTLSIKYESFCSFPNDELSNIFKFLDLEPTGYKMDFLTTDMHIMGNNEMRLVKFSGIRNREAWRDQLTKEQLNVFENISGQLNREIGYY